jgi:[ribosomal protein S5]-alanine N-acetyltransferase
MVLLDLPERIDTERLFLQRLRYEDAEEIFYTYASKPEATKYVAWPTHQSVNDTRSFLEYAIPAWKQGIDFSYAIRLKDSSRLIGSIGVTHDDGKVQLGYIISPTQWGQGFATETCRAIINELKQHKTLHRVWTLVDKDNSASIRVLEKCGLVEEARLPKWFRFINQGNDPRDCIFFRLPL